GPDEAEEIKRSPFVDIVEVAIDSERVAPVRRRRISVDPLPAELRSDRKLRLVGDRYGPLVELFGSLCAVRALLGDRLTERGDRIGRICADAPPPAQTPH